MYFYLDINSSSDQCKTLQFFFQLFSANIYYLNYHKLSLWQSIIKILKPVKGSANIGVMNSVNGEFYSGSSQLEFISKCSVKMCNSKDAISH